METITIEGIDLNRERREVLQDIKVCEEAIARGVTTFISMGVEYKMSERIEDDKLLLAMIDRAIEQQEGAA